MPSEWFDHPLRSAGDGPGGPKLLVQSGKCYQPASGLAGGAGDSRTGLQPPNIGRLVLRSSELASSSDRNRTNATRVSAFVAPARSADGSGSKCTSCGATSSP